MYDSNYSLFYLLCPTLFTSVLNNTVFFPSFLFVQGTLVKHSKGLALNI